MAAIKVSVIKEMTTAGIIANIFYMGIQMSGDTGTKADDLTLQRYCKELASRDVVDDWQELYDKMNK